MVALLVVVHLFVRANTDVVIHQPGKGGDKPGARKRLENALPEINRRIDFRILRQLVVQLRLVGMMQYIHHMGAAHALRVG